MRWIEASSVAFLLAAAPAHAQVFAPAAPPPRFLAIAWDSAPHTLSTARDFETLYTLYGAGVDKLFSSTRLDRGARGIVARLAKAPLDAYVAWLVALGSHEFGHCQQAWLAGSKDCHWISAEGPYALGHIITVGDAGNLTPAGRMAITTGGVYATITAGDALKREMAEDGGADWSTSPLLVFRQLDFTLYGLTAPSPAKARPLDYANDMTNYAIRYGASSGRGGETVHTGIVHGAWWNLADPMTWAATYSYIADYVVRGDRTRTIGLNAIGRSWTMTTNASLSEVGVRYALGVFVRDPRHGDVIEVTPSWGEGQPALGGRWSHPLQAALRATFTADIWRQRASAAPGPLATGGGASAGLSHAFGRAVLSGHVGYKTSGVMLGQPFGKGWFFEVGTGVRVPSTSHTIR